MKPRTHVWVTTCPCGVELSIDVVVVSNGWNEAMGKYEATFAVLPGSIPPEHDRHIQEAA